MQQLQGLKGSAGCKATARARDQQKRKLTREQKGCPQELKDFDLKFSQGTVNGPICWGLQLEAGCPNETSSPKWIQPLQTWLPCLCQLPQAWSQCCDLQVFEIEGLKGGPRICAQEDTFESVWTIHVIL